MAEGTVYARRMRAEIERWAREIARIEARMADAGAAMRAEGMLQIADLRARQAEAEAQWRTVAAEGATLRPEVRRDFESRYAAFSEATKTAARRFA
ncbi:MAG: hypothetical protein H5U20_10070 [Rhodobacteraceae bacterium]|nr:hypothetical protein [Paracoccaceae bacterium]